MSAFWGKEKVVLRQTPRAVTPFGGLSVFVEFLHRIGYRQQVMAVVAGARRFAHTGLLRADRGLQTLLGIDRFPTDGTLRNLFKRFTQGMGVRM
ncbi:MAG: hypothetical protein ACRD3D_03075 [Terriglobia bacterium]